MLQEIKLLEEEGSIEQILVESDRLQRHNISNQVDLPASRQMHRLELSLVVGVLVFKKGLWWCAKAGKAFAGAKNFFRGLKIPIIGPILLGIGSYMETGKLDNALFVAGGAAIGGILGSFIPIPILGTLLGETIGGYIGDLMYVLLKGGGPESLGQRLKQDLEKILTVGESAMKWIGSGLERYSEGLPRIISLVFNFQIQDL